MNVREARRQAAIERMADHILLAGMPGASLRPLAAAAGTSDRMLLYYFKDRAEVVSATLACVVARLARRLDRAVAAEPRRAASDLMPTLLEAIVSAELAPFMSLWLDLAAAAGRGTEPQLETAAMIADGFHRWIASRLDGPELERETVAARLLVALEGTVVLQAVGRGNLARIAADLVVPEPAPG